MTQLFKEMPAPKRPLPDKAIIGMIHLAPLRGSHRYGGSLNAILERAVEELNIYINEGADAVMLENMFDAPYLKGALSRDTVLSVNNIAGYLRSLTTIPMGIQLLEAANEDALKIASTADLDFIRVEGFVYGHLGGAGYIDACAGPLLRLRRELGVEHIQVLADIKKKHCAHAITGDLTIGQVAKQAEWFKADGLVVTGDFTGQPVDQHDLSSTCAATKLPIYIGSGVTAENIRDFMPPASGCIIGTYFKQDCRLQNMIDPVSVRRTVKAMGGIRKWERQ